MSRADIPLIRPAESLAAARVLQGWRYILWQAANDLEEFDVHTEDGRDLFLAESRSYSPAEVVSAFPPIPDMTWGQFGEHLKSLRGSARYVVRHRTTPGKELPGLAPPK
jgi:hypothetical protein